MADSMLSVGLGFAYYQIVETFANVYYEREKVNKMCNSKSRNVFSFLDTNNSTGDNECYDVKQQMLDEIDKRKMIFSIVFAIVGMFFAQIVLPKNSLAGNGISIGSFLLILINNFYNKDEKLRLGLYVILFGALMSFAYKKTGY